MPITIFPLVLAVVGALVYALADGKVSEAGRLAFFVGLIVFTASMAGHVLRIG